MPLVEALNMLARRARLKRRRRRHRTYLDPDSARPLVRIEGDEDILVEVPRVIVRHFDMTVPGPDLPGAVSGECFPGTSSKIRSGRESIDSLAAAMRLAKNARTASKPACVMACPAPSWAEKLAEDPAFQPLDIACVFSPPAEGR